MGFQTLDGSVRSIFNIFKKTKQNLNEATIIKKWKKRDEWRFVPQIKKWKKNLSGCFVPNEEIIKSWKNTKIIAPFDFFFLNIDRFRLLYFPNTRFKCQIWHGTVHLRPKIWVFDRRVLFALSKIWVYSQRLQMLEGSYITIHVLSHVGLPNNPWLLHHLWFSMYI